MPILVRCCCFFSLRQGSLLIAVIELLLSAIMLFLLLLGSTHTQDMATMLEADVEESERFLVQTDDDTTLVGRMPHHLTNHIRLHKAQHLTIVTLVALYTSIAIVTIHVISCILLVYGTIMQVRVCLLPWLSLVLMGLACSLATLLACLLLHRGSISLLLSIALFLQIRVFSWLVVYSYFRHLFALDITTCTIKIMRGTKTISTGNNVSCPHLKPAEV